VGTCVSLLSVYMEVNLHGILDKVVRIVDILSLLPYPCHGHRGLAWTGVFGSTGALVAVDLVVPGQTLLWVFVNGRLKLMELLLPMGIAGERKLLR